MAFDAADIARLKARIPDNYRPPAQAAGLLSDHFSSVDSLRESTALQGSERERFNLGMAYLDSDAEGGPSFRLNGALIDAHADRQHRKDRKEEQERVFVSRIMTALRERLDALDADLRRIDERLNAIRDRRVAIGDSLEALDEIERLRRSGELDPTNADHARLLEQAGIEAADAMGEDYAATLRERRAALGGEDDALDSEWNQLMRRREQVAAERDAVIEAQREIENADSEEARLSAERRAETMLGARQLGNAAYATQNDAARQIAARAVGKAEAEGLRQESMAWTQRVVRSVDAVTTTNIRDFAFDAETKKAPPAIPAKPSP